MAGSVDKLVLGTAGIGLDYGRPDSSGAPPRRPGDAELRDLLSATRALGIRCYDTAPVYGDAEQRLGAMLREDEQVWTKLDPGVHPATSIERSCRRLRRRRIDLLQWHNWQATQLYDQAFLDSWSELAHLHDAKAFGASTYGSDDALAALRSGCFDLVQVEWNLLDQHVIATVGSDARELGLQIAVRSVFLQGVLAGRPHPVPELAHGLRQAAGLARSRGTSLPVLALQAALEHPAIDRVLVGFDRVEQVTVAEQALAAPALSTADWQIIWQLHVGPPWTDPRRWT